MGSSKVWILLVVLIGVVLFSILLGAGLIYLTQRPEPVRTGTVVEVLAGGSVQELPPDNPLVQLFERDATSLWDLRRVFDAAAADNRVSSIYLEIRPLQWSFAQVEEVRDLIHVFRESGKPVHAFLAVDLIGEKELYLASACDHVTIPAEAGILMGGLLAEIQFYRRTLEKLRIVPEVIQFKEYKSPEVYERDELSPQMREMYHSLLGDIQGRFLETIAQERDLAPKTLPRLMEVGIFRGEVGLEEGLVDAVGHKPDVQERLAALSGRENDYRAIRGSQYLRRAPPPRRPSPRQRVAVLGGTGMILSGDSDPFLGIMGGSTVASHLRKIREDDTINGVIFRVNSPGGSVVGSNMVWQEVRLLEQTGKPVVVSMSGVAGSGGYYVSMDARRVISQPSTITGSIGVIFGKFDLSGFFDWMGISVDQVKLGPNADIFSLFSSLSPEQRAQIERFIEEIYVDFVGKAAEARGQSYEEFEPKAHGRIYTGAQAVELGLVDDLGGMDTAIRHMKEVLDLSEDETIELVLFPPTKTLWEALGSGGLLQVVLQHGRDLPSLLQQEIQLLKRPNPWLLMPEISIR